MFRSYRAETKSMCNRWKNGNNIFPRPGIEPGPLDSKSYTLPRRYKSRLVPQGSTSVSYTYTWWQSPPSNLKFVPEFLGVRESREMRLKEFYAHMWVIYVGRQMLQVKKMEITFFPDRGSNPVRWTQSPTLYHVAIKAGLYRKAVQVYHIPIPGDICQRKQRK